MSSPADFEMLATYVAECERGIVHTPEWDSRMATLQDEFDAAVEDVLNRGMQAGGGKFTLPPMTPAVIWDAIKRIQEQARKTGTVREDGTISPDPHPNARVYVHDGSGAREPVCFACGERKSRHGKEKHAFR